jgi:hypothetical protein
MGVNTLPMRQRVVPVVIQRVDSVPAIALAGLNPFIYNHLIIFQKENSYTLQAGVDKTHPF